MRQDRERSTASKRRNCPEPGVPHGLESAVNRRGSVRRWAGGLVGPGVGMGVLLLSAAAGGGVVFDAGETTVLPGGTAVVPIVVSGFTDVTTVQFTLAWDPAVLQYSSVGSFGLPGLAAGNFGYVAANPNRLTLSWDDPDTAGVTKSPASTIFSVSFTAVGSAGQHSAVYFTDNPTPRDVSVLLIVVPEDQLTWASGGVDIAAVPEPVNVALAAFASLFAVGSVVRWIRSRGSTSSNCSRIPSDQ